MTPLRLPHLLLCVPLLLAAPSLATAQQNEPPQRALENYQRAEEAYDNGDYELADKLLKRAFAEDPDLLYQYNRIRVLQKMGNYEEAIEVLDTYRVLMIDKGYTKKELDELDEELRSDLEEAKSAPVHTPPQIDPPIDRPTADPVERDPVQAPPELDDPKRGRRITGWVLLGAGAAAIAGTSPFWSGLRVIDEPCYDPPRDGEDGFQDPGECALRNSDDLTPSQVQERIEFDQRVGAIGLGVGVPLAITGIILVLISSKPDVEDGEEATALKSTSFAPAIGPGFTGGTLTVTF